MTLLQWRHNERDGVSTHRRLHCWFWRKSKKTPKLRVTGFFAVNSAVADEFPAQKASNAENVPTWWRHRVLCFIQHFTFCIMNHSLVSCNVNMAKSNIAQAIGGASSRPRRNAVRVSGLASSRTREAGSSLCGESCKPPAKTKITR